MPQQPDKESNSRTAIEFPDPFEFTRMYFRFVVYNLICQLDGERAVSIRSPRDNIWLRAKGISGQADKGIDDILGKREGD